MSIAHITRTTEIPTSGIAVVDCYATWCGPCKRVAPQYEMMVRQFPKVKFFKADIDVATDLAENFQLRAVPTFLVFQNGTLVLRVNGADLTKVEIQLNKLTGW
jgi:thioredoxin 1